MGRSRQRRSAQRHQRRLHRHLPPNQLGRYSLGTKSKNLRLDQDGSLALSVQQHPPQDDRLDNWLPAPAADFWAAAGSLRLP